MATINNPKVELIKAVAGPVNVSNFSKATVKCHLAAPNTDFNGGKCTITLFEAVRNGNAIDSVRIGSKVVNIENATDQDISVDFPRNNADFPGNGIFPHSYFALLQVRKAQGNKNEYALTPMKVLSGAALVVVP